MPVEHPLSPGGTTLVILDANVLLPPRLSDILFDLFLEGTYFPRWTVTIEQEFIRNYGRVVLAASRLKGSAFRPALPNAEHSARAEARLKSFQSAVGFQWNVLLYDQPHYLDKVPSNVNAGDTHVASASLVLHELSQQEGCNDKVFIVSNNLAHLAVNEMKALGISVVSPGAFINQLTGAAFAKVEKALLRTTQDLRAPTFTRADMLSLLVLHGAVEAANSFASTWHLDIPERSRL